MRGAVRASARALLLALAGSVLTLATAHQGGPAPSPALTTTETPVVISSPSASAYISGVTALRAAIDPSVPVQSVTFFVDGRQFCLLNEPPFECEWDAGSVISVHLIRLVVQPVSGDRIVKTLRTKGIGYADRVNVEAIQVTVTVADDAVYPVGSKYAAVLADYADLRKTVEILKL